MCFITSVLPVFRGNADIRGVPSSAELRGAPRDWSAERRRKKEKKRGKNAVLTTEITLSQHADLLSFSTVLLATNGIKPFFGWNTHIDIELSTTTRKKSLITLLYRGPFSYRPKFVFSYVSTSILNVSIEKTAIFWEIWPNNHSLDEPYFLENLAKISKTWRRNGLNKSKL